MGLIPGVVSSLAVRSGESENAPLEGDNDVSRTDDASVPVLPGLGFPALVTDAEGQIARLNDHACDLFGTDATSAIGERPEALLDDGSEVSAVAGNTSAVAQQVSATVEEIAAGIDEQTRAMD